MANQLKGVDGTFLYTDTRNTPETIGNFGIYDPSTARDGFVRFKDILRTFETRRDRVPTFTKKIMRVPMDQDQPYWIEDDNFDLESAHQIASSYQVKYFRSGRSYRPEAE